MARRPPRAGPDLARGGGSGRGCPSPRARRWRPRRQTGGRRCATCSCAASTSVACASSPTTAAARAASSTPIPVAALALWWPALQRQLRAEGPVERLAGEESDAYFASRGRGSRLGALASRQGSVIPGREVLDARLAELGERYGEEVPRPDTGAATSCARRDRVLGGPRQPPARPHALPARGRRLAQRAPQPVSSAAAATSAS